MTSHDPVASVVRVVVVTWQAGDHLAAMLDSLATATSAPVRVVVADNGSDDGAPQSVAARDGVHLLALGRNLGYGQAANAGAAVALPGLVEPWLLVVNPDVVWEPGALDELLAAADRHPRATALGPAVRTEDGDLYPSARLFPSLVGGAGHAALGWWWPANPWTAAYRGERGDPVEGPAGWLSGSCLLVRRDAFDAVGGFDPRFFMYFEDTELCRRLADAGGERVYVPSAVVTHAGGHATRRRPARMLVEHHRSAYRYLTARHRGARWAPARALLGAALSARLLLGLAVRRVGEGARPTRRADALPEGRPARSQRRRSMARARKLAIWSRRTGPAGQ